MLRKTLIVAVMSCIIACPAFAQNNPVRKATRGVANFVLSPVEIPRQVLEANEEEGDFVSISWGVAKGVGYTAGRALLGAYEVATFILPPYRPLVKPEFVFSEEDEYLSRLNW